MTGAALDTRVVVHRRAFTLDVALTAEPGEVIAVMGPSGAGKSTFVRTIAGAERLDDGHVRIGDRAVATARTHLRPALRQAVLLGQEPRLFPHLTAAENVAFGPRARGIDRALAAAEADDWLWRVGLPGAGPHRPHELSGGQQQRVAIARALATAPQLLLLDEPLTSLDPETAGEIRTMLHEQLAATRATAVIVTHDAVDAAGLATRLLVIEDGRTAQLGPVAEVLSAPATRFVAVASGLNRVLGVARAGAWEADGQRPVVRLQAADAESAAQAREDGAALAAVFRPSAVRIARAAEPTWTAALRLAEAAGDEDGTWLARVARLERTPAGARVYTAEPPVAVDVSAETVATLGLAPGVPVRLSVGAADVRLRTIAAALPAGAPPDGEGAVVPAVRRLRSRAVTERARSGAHRRAPGV